MLEPLPKKYIPVTKKNLGNAIKKIKDPVTTGVTIINAKDTGRILGAAGYNFLNNDARELASETLTRAVKANGVGEVFCMFA